MEFVKLCLMKSSRVEGKLVGGSIGIDKKVLCIIMEGRHPRLVFFTFNNRRRREVEEASHFIPRSFLVILPKLVCNQGIQITLLWAFYHAYHLFPFFKVFYHIITIIIISFPATLNGKREEEREEGGRGRKREEGRERKEEGRRQREEGRGKKGEGGRGKREEGGRKREEEGRRGNKGEGGREEEGKQGQVQGRKRKREGNMQKEGKETNGAGEFRRHNIRRSNGSSKFADHCFSSHQFPYFTKYINIKYKSSSIPQLRMKTGTLGSKEWGLGSGGKLGEQRVEMIERKGKEEESERLEVRGGTKKGERKGRRGKGGR